MKKRRRHPAKSLPPPRPAAPPQLVAPGPVAWREWLLLAGLMLAAAWLFLANLGDQCLWQDEAQTALIAKTVLTDGVPLAYDGKNYFSQELGRENGRNFVYRWHTWFMFYWLAGFFGLFGCSTFVARLPFALLGLATVPLTYFFARSLWQSRRAAVLAVILLSTSVPYLILSRQCRYYSPCAFFSLLGLFAYVHMVQRKRWAAALFVVAATLLFLSHYPYWGVLLASVLLHCLLYHRDRFVSVALWSFLTFLLNLPWLIWLLSPPMVGQYPGVERSLARPFLLLWVYVVQIAKHIFSPVLLGVVVVVGIVAGIRRKRFPLPHPAIRPGIVLLVLFAAVNVLALSVLTPFFFFRYLAPVIPVLCLLAALILEAAMRVHVLFGVGGLAALLFLSPMKDYVFEITHHYSGPTEAIAKFLNEHGKPDDVVAITYGDLPLKFYTKMRVVGGLTGEDLTPALKANWVIIRKPISEKDYAVMRYLLANLRAQDYNAIQIDCPDIPFDNRETPDEHLYRTVTGTPPVTIYQRIAP